MMEIEICGNCWEINKVEPHHPGLYVEGNNRIGACWTAKREIYISNELKSEVAFGVIAHELTHAIIDCTQIINCPEKYTEEDLCMFSENWCKKLNEYSERVWRFLFEK